jgi:catechol 2,3-dioxygenase-like lactoylglutathione lyase family enzyme
MTIELHTINLEAGDPKAAKRFYVDALGMTENLERSQPPDFFYLESVGCHLTLAKWGGASGEKPSRSMGLGFLVDDLAALAAHLAQRNVSGFKPQRMGWGEVLEGHDPEGHRVIIYSLGKPA